MTADTRGGNGAPLSPAWPDSLQRPDFTRLMLDEGYYSWFGGDDGRGEPFNDIPNIDVAKSWGRACLGLGGHELDELASGLKASLAAGDVDGFAHRLGTGIFGSGTTTTSIAN